MRAAKSTFLAAGNFSRRPRGRRVRRPVLHVPAVHPPAPNIIEAYKRWSPLLAHSAEVRILPLPWMGRNNRPRKRPALVRLWCGAGTRCWRGRTERKSPEETFFSDSRVAALTQHRSIQTFEGTTPG